MNNFLQSNEFINARKLKKPFFFSNSNFDLLTWDEVFNCLDFNVQKNSDIKRLENFGLVVHDTTNVLKVQTVLNQFSELDKTVTSSAHLYISLTSLSKTFGWHKDTSDVLFWQVIGSTEFSVNQNGIHIYHLKPNDFLYIPKGIFHNTKPLTPRVGVSMGLDYSY